MEENYIITFKWEGRKRTDPEMQMFQYCTDSLLGKTIKNLQQEGNVIVSINLITK